ncbi:hypothetical protein RGV33_16595 [Pseudomonas sp. Bout1]|uniref:hypothetical protein n=1 Tax=Pseudomonas sp. Bout1 TaxID=3048600 RepID=UPI002AB5B7FC|nr:hypothetical protein [Pseudomonas sp. Bout1]MDY7533280.1 hypothetical protein [Pseudomonas sp. Bout1]MEB0183845.1 hypothetical protein [Pseudomonas sp. Bout1]
MSVRIDKSHPVEYKTKKGVIVQIGFSWSPPLDIPVGATLTLVRSHVEPQLMAFVEGDHWESYDQAFKEAQEAADRWANLLPR